MSKTRLASGIVLLGAAGAVGYLAFRAGIEGQARAESAGRAVVAQAETERVTGEQRDLETRAQEAATLKPLNAALEDHVDDATLVDLFDNEDWWQPYRELDAARVIVGDHLLATRGKLNLDGHDAEAVKGARRQRLASTVAT